MGHVPRKRFGQHFLHEHGIIEKIVAAVDPRPGDLVVEIGPGLGALTRPLLDRLERLHVVELDRDLAQRLEAEFGPDRLAVHRADALEFDFGALGAGLRVVGNLPYNVSTPLLFHIARSAGRLRDLHFMLQREVVERMVAAPSTPEYGRLSVMLQYRFAMEKLFLVSPGCFRPPPKVESAMVRLVPLARPDPLALDEEMLAAAVTRAFTRRRKTLRNALAGVATEADLASVGINAGLRPENLSVADYVRIANLASQRAAASAR
ncbi:MAG TPA: 16S rRNA (adenine(1518)-N(6)/adenine(1519)-N(6))-dimethyltransferase RsmA [Burkholderiales bacterium]|nr:16S rRNA (adenine(1518)-N(6)/adenine(1519)-N(6))-dimethyltransferase RsmA [Burkholderiales bacterium]